MKADYNDIFHLDKIDLNQRNIKMVLIAQKRKEVIIKIILFADVYNCFHLIFRFSLILNSIKLIEPLTQYGDKISIYKSFSDDSLCFMLRIEMKFVF